MRRTSLFVLALLLPVSAALLAQDFDAVEIRTVQVSESIYMLVRRDSVTHSAAPMPFSLCSSGGSSGRAPARLAGSLR